MCGTGFTFLNYAMVIFKIKCTTVFIASPKISLCHLLYLMSGFNVH